METKAILLTGAAALITAAPAPLTHAQTPGGAGATVSRGAGFGCPSPKVWSMKNGVAVCEVPPPPAAPPPPPPAAPSPPPAPPSGVCPAGMRFQIEYQIQGWMIYTMWITYEDGSRGNPIFNSSPYMMPNFTDSYPTAPDGDGVHRLGWVAVPGTIPNGGGLDTTLIMPAIGSHASGHWVAHLKCSAGRLSEVWWYGDSQSG